MIPFLLLAAVSVVPLPLIEPPPAPTITTARALYVDYSTKGVRWATPIKARRGSAMVFTLDGVEWLALESDGTWLVNGMPATDASLIVETLERYGSELLKAFPIEVEKRP